MRTDVGTKTGHDSSPTEAETNSSTSTSSRFGTRRRVLAVLVLVVAAVAVAVIAGNRDEKESQPWTVEDGETDYAARMPNGPNNPWSVGNETLSLTIGTSVNSSPTVDQPGFVVMSRADGVVDFVALDVPEDDFDLSEARLTVGPAGFAAEIPVGRRGAAFDPGSRLVVWSPDGRRWTEAATTAPNSLIVVGHDGFYEIDTDAIHRLDAEGHLDVPWQPDMKVLSAAASDEALMVETNSSTGRGIWIHRSGEWTYVDTFQIRIGEAGIEVNASLELVSSGGRVFALDMDGFRPSPPASDVPAAIGWSSSNGAEWHPIEIPAAAAAAKPERRLHYVGTDSLSLAHYAGGTPDCSGSSFPCEQIPPFTTHIASESMTLTGAHIPQSEAPAVTDFVGLASNHDALLTRSDLGQDTTQLIRIPAEPFDINQWFNAE